MSKGKITVLGMRDKCKHKVDYEIFPISRDQEFSSLSPFFLGPCLSEDGIVFHNMENLWQFSKVYGQHVDEDHSVTHAWWEWYHEGATDTKAHRYPMGKGAVPLYSRYGNMRLSYIAARKLIYIPQYIQLVEQTAKFRTLLSRYHKGKHILLRDFDAYDLDREYRLKTDEEKMLLCINNPNRRMGHGFVLGWHLERYHDDPLWYKRLIL